MSNWTKYQFKNLGTTYGGLVNKNKDDFGFGKPYIPYLNIFGNTFIDPKFLDYVNINNSEKQNKTKYGDLFFTTSSETPEEVGMTSVLHNEFEELYLNSFCFGFRLHNFDIMLPIFAGFLFRSSLIRKNISILAQGSTRYNLSKSIFFDKLFINLPPLPHQRKIARILTTVDNVIETTESAIAKYKAIKQGMMHDLFTRGIDTETGKLRPTKEEAPHLYKNTELGWIPKEWEVVTIDEFAGDKNHAIVDGPFGSNLKSIHYRSSGIPIIQSGFVTNNEFFANNYLFVDKDKFYSEIRSKVVPGDIIMAKIGAQCGTCAVLPLNHPVGIIAGNCLKISVEKNNSNRFLECLLHHFYKIGKIDLIISTTAQPAVSMSSLKKMKIQRPDLDEQLDIMKKINSMIIKIKTEQKQLSKLQKLKQGLMQDLLTGKKEVEPDKEDYDE